ncbi:9457_t:CDS:2 [Paraglomus brasilianum]|uniref:9457_t:CDS:1 n=1 Tax=Paraglomus brasilianum TaxID=144538 RepID=A0A9N8W063_9GLOM|nr:9457_t:CDS:2 [Paraglomus brasilianum]
MTQAEVSYLPLTQDKTVLSAFVPQHILSQWFTSRRISLFIALDISGSMSGSGITQAKAAILTLLEKLLSTGAVLETDITCFFFHHSCQVVPFEEHPELRWANDGIRRYFDNVNAGGGTSFGSVFTSIRDNIYRAKHDLVIIFFTDGQDGCGLNAEDKLRLAKTFADSNVAVEVHTIGFTSGHDAALLSWLTTAGTNQGNFQYVKSSSDIPETMSVTLDLLSLEDRTLHLKVDEFESARISINDEGKGTVILPNEQVTNLEKRQILLIKDKDGIENERINLIRRVEENSPEANLLYIYFIQREITRLSNEVINLTHNNRKVLNNISDETSKYDEKLNLTLERAFKTKSAHRNVTIQLCMETKAILNRFNGLLSEALKGTLTNEKIASFNDLAYKNVTKQRLKKKLDSRIMKNVEQMEAVEERIKNVVNTLDFDKLEEEETSENLRTFTCALTTDNYVEAMREGECLCLTLDLGRSQAAIADPTQMRIKKINQSFLTSDAFMNAVKYALDEAQSAEDVHGGFSGSSFSASILKGLAREDITGVLPLYINDKHWLIAKEKMKPIMGYITTLDVLGYTYSQMTTIPFLVLAAALSDTSTQFRQWQLKLILETCDAIYKQSTNLREENKQLFAKYLASPLNRTIDVVANNDVFLGHLLCAFRCGDVSAQSLQTWLDGGMVKYLIEENIRRRLNISISVIDNHFENIQTALGIDQTKYFDVPRDEFEQAYTTYLKQIKEASKTTYNRYVSAFHAATESSIVGNEKIEDQMEVAIKPKFKQPIIRTIYYDANTYGMPETTKTAIVTIKRETMHRVEIVLRFNKLFEYAITNATPVVTEAPDLRNFTEDDTKLAHKFYASFSPKVFLATFLQAFNHRQNSTRREAAAADPPSFYEPFSEVTADIIISENFNDYVNRTTKRIMNDIIESYTRQEDNAIGLSFWEADSMEEAAGMLMLNVRFRGRKVYAQIVKAIQKPNMPCSREKIEMLTSGVCRGVKLFEDRSGTAWLPSRQNLYRTLRAQKPNIPDIDFWIGLFPSFKEYLEHQFDDTYIENKKHERYLERIARKKV